MTMLEQIQNNDIVDLHISAPADEVFDHRMGSFLLDALEQNTSIQTIHLEQDFLGDLRNDDRSKLMHSIGQVKSLKEVTLGDALMQINDITKMINSAKSLGSLRLRSMLLQGIESDFDACEATLYQHVCMKEFEMDNCEPAISEISMDKLEKAGRKFSGSVPLAKPATMNSKTASSA
jgi:hypothetical protein